MGAVAVTAILTLLYRSKSRPKTLKDPNTKYPLKLVEKINLSHDTRIFR